MGEDRSRVAKARIAWIRLGTFVLLMAAGIVVALSDDPNPPFIAPPGATSDQDFFGHVVARVRGGEGFYDASQRELQTHGYPSRSVFNWRTPLYAWVFGTIPSDAWCRVLLCGLVVLTFGLLCRDLLNDVGMIPSSLGGIFLVGATAWCVGRQTFLFTEIWAGILIALSLALQRREKIAAAVGVGLFALFFRELTLPFVLVSLGVAAYERRWREVLGWCVGLLVFFGFMGLHAGAVASRLTPLDQAMPGGWVRFGGLRFVLTTAQTNVFLMGFPLGCTAIFLALALLGLSGWDDPIGRRVGFTVSLYVAAFGVAGAPFNFYWGFLIAPLLALGIARVPRVIAETARDLASKECDGVECADLPGRFPCGKLANDVRRGKFVSPPSLPLAMRPGESCRDVGRLPHTLP